MSLYATYGSSRTSPYTPTPINIYHSLIITFLLATSIYDVLESEFDENKFVRKSGSVTYKKFTCNKIQKHIIYIVIYKLSILLIS